MNQNISCFIVEDDPQALEYATTIIRKHEEIEILGNSDTIEEAAKWVKELQPDFFDS